MPRETNKTARVVIPIVALLGALGIALLTIRSPQTQPANPPQQTAQGTTPAESLDAAEDDALLQAPDPAPSTDTNDAPLVPPAASTSTPSIAQTGNLHVRFVPPAAEPLETLGGDGSRLVLTFTPVGAGVDSITLTEYFETLKREVPYSVQERQQVENYTVASLASRTVTINGQVIDLFSSGRDDAWIWEQTDQGAFVATIVNQDDVPVARIEKRFILGGGSFAIHVEQTLVNLTEQPLDVQWVQYGPVDLPKDEGSYGGDKRRAFFGHLSDPKNDPTQEFVLPSKQLSRQKLVSREESQLWPPSVKVESNEPLVWAAMTNRYFAFAVHAPVPLDGSEPAKGTDKRFVLGQKVYRIVLGDIIVLELHSDVLRVEAGESLDLSLASYAGPLWRKTLGSEPALLWVGLDKLVVYNFGGPCAFCTFQPLARTLLWFLGTAHNYLVFDWGLAILLLVLVVRTILHPITKKSQISLQRFTKQMQGIGPKQKELQAKYKDEPKRMQAEMAALFREEGVQFRGALGCLPMFMQTPVWIALFAMLYFAFDLRQQPAFFGVFQAISGGSWGFLSDLSAPDGLVPFGIGFSVPLMGKITSLNILPLLLGIVFYLQQKYLTPPPSASMTPEQQSQQKIMKVMMVVMFPVFMYNAPSGLTIYFITNSTLGILESRYIRAHIKQLDENPPKAGRKKRVRNTASQNPFSKKKAAPSYKDRKPK